MLKKLAVILPLILSLSAWVSSIRVTPEERPPYTTLYGQAMPSSFATIDWVKQHTVGRDVTFLSTDPVLVQIDDFLTESECDVLIQLGEPKLQRSKIGFSTLEPSMVRTSSTSWIDKKSPNNSEDVRMMLLIEARIAEITGLPTENQESFQVLRYEAGQYYHVHHDYLDDYLLLPCGPRVATFFMYLSEVEEGGATYFDKLEKRVTPKKGRAVLWFNTLNNTLDVDLRLTHSAETVVKGRKWGINKWIHSHDFYNNYWANKLTL